MSHKIPALGFQEQREPQGRLWGLWGSFGLGEAPPRSAWGELGWEGDLEIPGKALLGSSAPPGSGEAVPASKAGLAGPFQPLWEGWGKQRMGLESPTKPFLVLLGHPGHRVWGKHLPVSKPALANPFQPFWGGWRVGRSSGEAEDGLAKATRASPASPAAHLGRFRAERSHPGHLGLDPSQA